MATLKDSQKSLTDDRKEAFLGKGESLQNLIIQIKAAVESQYGKKTSEATMINRSIALMRDAKPKKAVPETANETEETRSNKVEKSYGSMAEVLNDIISSLSNYPDYATSNEKVKIEALRETSAKLDNFNARVTKIKLETNTAQDERVKMYEELNTRAQRIKTYVKGQYGVNSREYISIKSLRF